MEIQLQIYLILGVGGFLIFLLLLSNALLIYYVVKLNGKLSNQRRNTEPLAINAYDNQLASSLQEELSRRYTQYTPEPTLVRPAEKKSNKNSLRSQNANVTNSVITASEEFRWEQSGGNERTSTSNYNSNIVMLRTNDQGSDDEGRMRF